MLCSYHVYIILWVHSFILRILYGIKTIRFNYVLESFHKSYQIVQFSKMLFQNVRNVVIKSLNFKLKFIYLENEKTIQKRRSYFLSLLDSLFKHSVFLTANIIFSYLLIKAKFSTILFVRTKNSYLPQMNLQRSLKKLIRDDTIKEFSYLTLELSGDITAFQAFQTLTYNFEMVK